MAYHLIDNSEGSPIKAWTSGVALDPKAEAQLRNVAKLPFIFRHIAVMPDVHWGIGATVGSVIPTRGAIVPAAVGVDIGCGMMAVQTTLKAKDLPESLKELRSNIERAVPHGRTHDGRRNDRGAWGEVPSNSQQAWGELKQDYQSIIETHPKIESHHINHINHLGTLGTGNHFIEVCLDEDQHVWLLLHSGSRGVGNRLGNYFIELAKQDLRNQLGNLPDADLAYFKEGSKHFEQYCFAVEWAQRFARKNRELMMQAVIRAVKQSPKIPSFEILSQAINCHHNYVAREKHFGHDILVTRKGAVRAGLGELGIIPGSMGAATYIVRGLGNPQSFESCSHGAGRLMSRNEAKKRISLEEHKQATSGIECRKDRDVIDESPAAYKPIDAVMNAQKDLVEVVHTLKQVVCVKG